MENQIIRTSAVRNASDAGFSLFLALLVVLFFGFLAAVLMNLMRIRYAVLGFVAVVVIATLIAAFPDIRRYIKISSM